MADDEVQTVEPWQPPDTWAELPTEALHAALTEIDAGLSDGRRYSDAPRAKDTAAWLILRKHCPHKSEQQCRDIIKTWAKNGLLYTIEYMNPANRHPQRGLRVDDTKRPA